MSIAPGLDEEAYREHQERNPDHEIEGAMDRSGVEKSGSCDACGRDVREGEELCETCDHVENDLGIDLREESDDGPDLDGVAEAFGGGESDSGKAPEAAEVDRMIEMARRIREKKEET